MKQNDFEIEPGMPENNGNGNGCFTSTAGTAAIFSSGLSISAPAESAEESSATSEELSAQAYSLNEVVGKFTLRRD